MGIDHEKTPFARAKRSLGQNFLVDDNIVRKIVGALGSIHEETIVEIGPGRGALTKAIMAASPGRYVAIEMDRELAPHIKSTFAEKARVDVICANALDMQWEKLSGLAPVKIVGNLPYNVASPLMWDIVSRARQWSLAVFMVQYEVARRIVATPGNKEYGGLSVWLQSYATPRLLFKVPPSVFRPRPKVDSAVVAFVPRSFTELPLHGAYLARLIKQCFGKRRKQMQSILRDDFDSEVESIFVAAGVHGRSRPEELSPEVFEKLSNVLAQRA
ncbi:16S rRNA (adenine(1518)-N(6)/adenine(1519)-N(6))-dimethyltransferase RsmA [Desulfovibrio inopinatus]|uniref:16S rRNA (adenine(1518)-N(6)/adenine(1519)-N(6))- dimethyltransferase RsmA n=1 Tax=Desulfovibrio inopinatus TaxID=102109 RepID=UPI00041B8113|nr:16S rRNA (adenine(1518)-N(6)/adenine(1519)-N(6))-dimethyltransferase RsmA [Desulfovibrio inopinatus]